MVEVMKPQILLLHGAYHGPSLWDGLRGLFTALGTQAKAPDLRGDRIEPVRKAVLETQERSLLVAHSLAGVASLALLAEEDFCQRLFGVVFLSAYLPRAGESAADLVKLDRGAGLEGAIDVDRDHGLLRIKPEKACGLLYNEETPSSSAVEQQLKALEAQRISDFRFRLAPDWRMAASAPKRAYIVCTRDRAITPALQRRMASDAGCEKTLDMPSGHMPMITHPRALLEQLAGLFPEIA